MSKSESLKRRKAEDLALARAGLVPIMKMRFDGYATLADRPPEENIRLSRLFLIELHKRGRDLASGAKVEFDRVFLDMGTGFRRTDAMIGSKHGWKSEHDDRSWWMATDWVGEGGVSLPDIPTSLAAPSLYEQLNTKLLTSAKLPEHFSIADFLVIKFGNHWAPMALLTHSISAQFIIDSKDW